MNYINIKKYRENHERFDSLLMGSSRVGNINVSQLKDGTYYNLWYLRSIPAKHLRDLKFFLAKEYEIRNVVIGLDNFAYRQNDTMYNNLIVNEYQCRYYPYTVFERIRFFFYYLIMPPDSHLIMTFLSKTGRGFNIYVQPNGVQRGVFLDEAIEAHPKEHEESAVFKSAFRQYNDFRLDETISELQEIKFICDAHNIKLRVFVNPIFMTSYLSDTPEEFDHYMEFKKRLAGITPFYDFSGISSITTRAYYFYDNSHSRAMVGDMILAKMFNSNPDTCPDDFGVYVTAENVDAHIKKQKEEYLQYKEEQ
ncbi:MAG: hypothetical protein JXA20_03810 [Spirochaetes bacterium]|nr:hypothetical protein [Spirochaetota bacterium]